METTSLDLENVSNWSMGKCSEYLEKANIKYDDLCSANEMRARIRQHIDGNLAYEEKNSSQKLMEDILSRDKKMKDELLEIYSWLITFLKNDLDGKTASVIEKLYDGDLNKLVEKKKEELGSEECPIVVAGETSAGKSSLLNLIIGEEVLPQHHLCATSTICRLHNSTVKKIEVIQANGEKIIENINSEIPEAYTELKQKLKPYTFSMELREETKYKQVEIYWPIPLLQDRVTIVDTPGVGESEKMTERLLEYLPNAVAFIYVINSANAGGIQQDKLVKILNKQREWELQGKILPLDYSAILFVCNKWDIVEKSCEEEKVWTDTLEQLRKVIPHFPEEQVYKMSVTETERFRRCGIVSLPKFRKFQDGITELIPKSLSAKLKRHYKFLDKFLFELMSRVSSWIEHAKLEMDDRLKLQDRVVKRLKNLKINANRVRKDLITAARRECNDMVEVLLEHVNNPNVQKRLLTWREEDIPGVEELGDIKLALSRCESEIGARLMTAFTEAEKEKHLVKKATDALTQKFKTECAVLEEDCLKVRLELAGLGNRNKESTQEYSIVLRDLPDLSLPEAGKIVLAISSPVWIPLVTAAIILLLPVSVGFGATMLYKSSQTMKHFAKNKVKYMQEWTRKALKTVYNESNIKNFLFDYYFRNFRNEIDKLCGDFIPKLIAADELQIKLIVANCMDSSQILSQCEPMIEKLKNLQEPLKLFELFYLQKRLIDPSDIQIKDETDKGMFSDVNIATWTRDNREMTVILKVLEWKIKDPDISQQLKLKEIEILRTIVHPNIVELYGLGYADAVDKENESQLTMVLEYCEDNLENIVFKNKNLQCGIFRTNFDRYDALRFYVRMATGVCDGLAEIHRLGFLHRDLRLANVLVNNRTAKLSNFGYKTTDFTKTWASIYTLRHVAPEVLKQEQYTFRADIFSLGILMWELWYGRHAYSETQLKEVCQLLDTLKTGIRPEFNPTLPTNELREVMKMCWHDDPRNRPNASDASTLLRQIYRRDIVNTL